MNGRQSKREHLEAFENRIAELEQKVSWFMDSMAQQAVVPTGIIHPDGRVQAKAERRTFSQLYQEFKNARLQA